MTAERMILDIEPPVLRVSSDELALLPPLNWLDLSSANQQGPLRIPTDTQIGADLTKPLSIALVSEFNGATLARIDFQTPARRRVARPCQRYAGASSAT
jgi:hypothetical protein